MSSWLRVAIRDIIYRYTLSWNIQFAVIPRKSNLLEYVHLLYFPEPFGRDVFSVPRLTKFSLLLNQPDKTPARRKILKNQKIAHGILIRQHSTQSIWRSLTHC